MTKAAATELATTWLPDSPLHLAHVAQHMVETVLHLLHLLHYYTYSVMVYSGIVMRPIESIRCL